MRTVCLVRAAMSDNEHDAINSFALPLTAIGASSNTPPPHTRQESLSKFHYKQLIDYPKIDWGGESAGRRSSNLT